MTRESKLALVISITLVLLVGVLISDHMSGATVAEYETPPASEPVVNRPLTAGIDGIDRLPRGPETVRADAPVVIAQGPTEVATEPSSILGSAIDRLREGDTPVLMGDGLFQRVDERTVTLPPRDERKLDAPVKPVGEPTVIRQSPDRSAQAPERWITHTVQEGESLYAIARDRLGDGSRWPELQKLNDELLDGGEAIRVGMVLRIAPASGAAREPEPAPKRPGASAGVREYVVAKGDILGNIASELLGSAKRMHEIVELNGLKDPNDIRVGQTLKIPAR